MNYGRFFIPLTTVCVLSIPAQVGSSNLWDPEGKALMKVVSQVNPHLDRETCQRVSLSFEKYFVAHHLKSRAKALAMISMESSFDPAAVGDKGNALGLCQINYTEYGKSNGLTKEDLLDSETNIRIGLSIWKDSGEEYSRYNPAKPGVWFYREMYSTKLEEIKRLM